ncbi:MAG: RelA/SpoT family protein [Bacteroidota bacterium]
MAGIDRYSEELRREILTHYKGLISASREEYDREGMKMIRKSVDFIIEQTPEEHTGPGQHLVINAIGLAGMTVSELGLDALGVSSVLIMHGVEQQFVTLDQVTEMLGTRISGIVEEWLRISDLDTTTSSTQAENMRNLILTLATDFRVILVKIAERLFLMRRMEELTEKEQIALSVEARYIYSPLAHRLGLYNVMSEMEDLAMSVLEKEAYQSIDSKLKAATSKRNRFISQFLKPIEEELEREKVKADIKGRPKAISSIWRKMRKQKVDFEEIYDKFAIRIIIDTTPAKEKADCWRVYSIITDHYQPNPERLRDWISAPKSNGYESLHTTVVVPGGDWVEVQIRTRRMNEIAEKGLAAHWKYKGIKGQAGIDQWIARVREALESSDEETNSLIEDLKLSQFSKELFVFTPNGDLKKFPEQATVLDFAFDIHTDVGASCVGARVNGKNVPIRYKLQNGDKVEVLRSRNQKPKVDWLNVVVTSKAKNKIKLALKEEKLKESDEGKEILKRRFRNWKIDFDDTSVRTVIQHFKYRDAIDLYFDVATEKVDLLQIKELLTSEKKLEESRPEPIEESAVEKLVSSSTPETGDFLVIDDKLSNVEYRLAKCCNPIHGDSIFGFVTINSGITIHRKNCPNAQQLLSRYAYRVVKARWSQTDEGVNFMVTLQVTGVDELGIVSNISDVISKDLQVNMRSITIDSNDGLFEGSITLFVKDTQHLEALIRKLKKVKGVMNIRRTN